MANTVSWMHLTFTNREDLLILQDKYGFPKRVVSSLLDHSEIAHIRLHDDFTYLLLNFPHEPIGSGNHVTNPIAILIRDNTVYFVTNGAVPIDIFFATFDEQPPEHIPHIISGFFLYMLEHFTTILSHTEALIAKKEATLFRKPKNHTIENLLHIQKGMIHFKVAIVGFKTILQTITDRHPELLWDEYSDREYSTINIETSQVEMTIHVIDELITSIISVSDSIYANNLSRTMQTLTSITLVLSIPTLVASIFGMNIPLPLQSHPQGLLIVSFITMVVTIGVAFYLYRQDWF